MKRLAMMLGLGWMLVLAVDGCTDRKVAPGKACLVNTDCDSPLSCSFGKCHQTCREARDCDPGQDCVRGADGNVCLLVPESKCGLNSDCVVGLFCAQDMKCRSQCEERSRLRHLDPAVRATGQGLRGARRHRRRRNAEASSRRWRRQRRRFGDVGCRWRRGQRRPAAQARPAAGAAGGRPAPGAARAATGSGGSAGGGQTIVLPCNGVEPTVNDTHAQATPLAINDTVQGCVEAAADHDFYQVTVPADAAGGILKIAITEVGAFRADATLYSSSDFAELKSSTGGTDAQSVFFYVATTPGASYQLEMAAWSPASTLPASRYTVRATYTALPDPTEPNDTRFDAKTITVGTPVQAYLFAGYASARGGLFRRLLQGHPRGRLGHGEPGHRSLEPRPRIWLYDPNGVQLKTASTSTLGGGLTVTSPVTAGDYYVRGGVVDRGQHAGREHHGRAGQLHPSAIASR